MNLSTLSRSAAKKLTGNAAIKICTTFFLSLILMLAGLNSFAQTTYTWAGGVTASWAVAGSWSPARNTPAVDDILIFSTGGTVTATAIPTQTIGQLSVSGSTTVNLQSAAAATTLSIAGGTGTDLSVASGSQLNYSGTTSLIVSVLTGATGSITGNMTTSSTVASTVHQLLAADASGITFNSGATFLQSTNSTGNVFGSSGTANTIIFASGSAFMQGAGSNPFGLGQPASKVVFQTGSLFKMLVSSAPSLSGRSYANFEWAIPSGTQSLTGTGALSMDNLTITSGSLNINLTAGGVNIKGNISVASGATLGFSPASANTLTFSGTTAQTINRVGTLTFAANAAVVIANTGSPIPSVTFNQSQTISGSTTVNVGSILATSGTLTLAGTPTINGSFQINGGGWATGGTWSYGAAGTLIFNNSSGSYGVNADVWWPAASGPVNVTVAGAGGITMNVSRTVSGVFQTAAAVTNAGSLTLNGTGKINAGGFFAATPVWGASSTLIYNTGTTYGRNNEFPNSGNLPSNVQVSNNTTINYPNAGLAARTITGNLTVDAGSAFYMDFGNPNPGVGILTINSLVLDGNLSLGSQPGGDLVVKGNFTRTGTFTPTSRAVFLNAATGDQTITGSTTFDYLIVDKAAGSVVLANNITVAQVVTLTNGTVNTAANKVILSSNATSALVRTNGYVNGNLQRAINTGANTYNFAVGTSSGYTPASLAFTAVGGAGNITMSSANAAGANYPANLSASTRLARSWSGTNSGVTGISGSATFTYLPADLVGGAVSGNLKAYVYDGSTSFTSSNTNTSSSFTYNALTTIGEFGAGECGTNFLPTFTTTMVSSCGGGADGTITVTPVGGVGPYTYNWSSTPGGFSGNTAAVTGLTPRDYTVVVTDAIGCTATILDITIFQALAVVVTNNGGGSGSCANTGYIELFGSGGVQPYTYSIDGTNYFVSNSFTGLAAGTYTGYVQDLRGCISTKPNIVITAAAAMVVTANPIAASSCANDGRIQLFRTGGVPGYTYSLNDIDYQVSNEFTNLAGNATYTGWVMDAAGCKASLANIAVGKAATLAPTFSKTMVSSCGGGADGSITVTPVGGVAPYTYSWSSNPSGFSGNTAMVTGLTPRDYTVVITDAAGCTATIPDITLYQAFAAVVTNNGGGSSSCGNTGYILLYGSGGVQPFTYSIDGTNYFVSNSFTGLAAGTYTGYVKDFGGCVSTKPNIVVTGAAAMVVTANTRPASSCANNGVIELYRTGGVAPYTYSLDDVTYQGSNTFNNLVGNATYTGWVQDASGCKTSLANIAVGKAPAITVSSTANNTSACSNTGRIQILGGGGVPGYTYSITGPNGTYQASNTFTGLAAGSYNTWVQDSKGCKNVQFNVTVGTNAAPTITVTAYARSASSCSVGSIQLFRTGGTGPYTYSLDNVNYQASPLFTGLAGGTYTGYVKDVNTCTGSLAGIIVAQAAAVTVTESHTNTSSCANDGTIQLTPGGGEPGYTYSLDNINYQAGNSFTGKAAGSYTGWVKDSRGCTASVPVTIGTTAAIVVTAYATAATNCETSNGSIQLFRTGGTGPYTYSLDNVNYQASNTFTGLLAGSYTGYVKDSKTCVGTLANIVVGPECAPPPIAGSGTNTKVNVAKVSGNDILTVQAYPNPTATEFTLLLTSKNKERIVISVTDILGRKVQQAELSGKNQYRFGADLKPGIYIVQVVQAGQKQSIKLVKE